MASPVGGVLIALSSVAPGRWLGVAAVVLAAGLVLAARRLAPSIDRAATALACVLVIPGTLGALVPVLTAVIGPLGWWAHGWSGSLSSKAIEHLGAAQGFRYERPSGAALAQLVAVAVFGVVASEWLPAAQPANGGQPTGRLFSRRAAVVLLAAVAVPAVAVATLITGADIACILAVELLVGSGLVALALWAARRSDEIPRPVADGDTLSTLRIGGTTATMGCALGLSALGWSTATPGSTLVGLGVVCAWGAAGTVAGRADGPRSVCGAVAGVCLLAFCGVAGGLATGRPELASLVVVAAAAALLLAARAPWLSGARLTLEAEALAGLLAPCILPLGARSWAWLAAELTLGAAAVAAASAWGDRPAYRWASAAASLPVACAWLAASGVRLPEAYTWTAAVGWSVVSFLAMAHDRDDAHRPGSWLVFGPGIVLALGPSTVLALGEQGLARPVCLIVLALGIVVGGAKARLQAPIVLGLASLAAIGIRAAWPLVANGGNLWLTLGIVGAALLWMGATAERRVAELQKAASRFRRLH
jgi:hypothetical protein